MESQASRLNVPRIRGPALVAQQSTRSLADADLGQLFYALRDDQEDEDLAEVLREFLVPASAA
jgi:hypothetical protein